ncbi:MAG: hypothetical protein EBU31_12685 [Proteobacteria bacterium]|nr:hypothetical protein [Pseudomonadota bacterium]
MKKPAMSRGAKQFAFSGGRVWAQLSRAARSCRSHAFVAVPYVSQAGDRMLPLRPGSVLLVDASEATVRSGATCPKTLQRLRAKGIRIFSNPALHAKVYVFGKRTFVGSANASTNSRDFLEEAILETTDVRIAQRAKDFITSRLERELVDADFEHLIKIAPKRTRAGDRGRRPKAGSAGTWIAQIKQDDHMPKPMAARNRSSTQDAAVKRASRRKTCQVFTIWMPRGCRFAVGDTVFQIFATRTGAKMVARPPSTIIRKRDGEDGRLLFDLEAADVSNASLSKLSASIPKEFRAMIRSNRSLPAKARNALFGFWATR